jgi:hypothetical protein
MSTNLEKEMIPVPIPTEIPEPPSLDQIPMDILHSATVELLIQQNEDLSSRLKVNIRRNSQLELDIIKKEKLIKDLQQKKENVLAQMEIIKEKEKIWSDKQKKNDQQMKAMKSESDLMELRYSELHTTSQQKSKEQQLLLSQKHKEIQKLEDKLEVARKVRTRAKEKLRTFLLEVAGGIYSNEKTIKKSESSNRLLKRNFEFLKQEITEKENFFKEQLHNFKQASQSKLFEVDQKLTEALEKNKRLQSDKDELQEELAQRNLEFHEEKKNRLKVTSLTEQLQILKNEKIQLKKQLETKDSQWSDACQMERNKNKAQQKEIEELQKQLSEQKNTLSTCESKLLSLSKDNKEISAQLASIQKLWIEAQDKLEKSELRAESLEKINRELSRFDQKDKLERRTQRAASESTDNNSKSSKEKENTQDNELKEKIKNAFAGQYSQL